MVDTAILVVNYLPYNLICNRIMGEWFIIRVKSTRAGFSLIELSIMFLIVATVMAGALSWLAPTGIAEAQRRELSWDRLRNIERALQAFRVYHGRLPCAADRTLADDDPQVGQENCTGVGGVNVGAVPTRTLGIDASNLVDGWGRRFTYTVATSVCGIGPGGNESTPLNCSSVTYEDAAAGDLTVNIPDPSNADPENNALVLTSTAVYVVFSHGQNGGGAYLGSGSPYGVAAAGNEAENANSDTIFWNDEPYANYDDLLVFAEKSKLDYLTTEPDNRVITLAECQAISTAIEDIGATTVSVDDEVSDMQTHLTFGGVEDSNIEVMRVLWYMQEVCREYFPTYYVEANIKCPGLRLYDGGSDTGTNDCHCYGANPTWAAGTDTCS